MKKAEQGQDAASASCYRFVCLKGEVPRCGRGAAAATCVVQLEGLDRPLGAVTFM